MAAVLVYASLSSEAAQQRKPKKSKKTAHGTVMALQPPTPASATGFLMLAVKATKKQGGGIGPEQFLLAADTALAKHGPMKGVLVPAQWADLVPGSKVTLQLHPVNPNLAVSVTVTSAPKKGKKSAHGTVMALQAPTPASATGFLVLTVKATKKKGGGVGPQKFLIAAETAVVKHGPMKGVLVPGSWAEVVPGSKVKLDLHPAEPNLAACVTITSAPRKKKGSGVKGQPF
jgi:hypothetical protein